MATEGTRLGKRKRSEQREGLRNATRQCYSPLKCPICEVTVRPESLPHHYQHELDKLQHLQPSSTHRRREPRPSTSSSTVGEDGQERGENILTQAKKVLESVQRKRFLFEHRSCDQLGSTSQSHDSLDVCPVCSARLPPDDEGRAAHVDSCLREQQGGGGGGGLGEGEGGEGGEETEAAADSDSESYEEYTWCNTTRIRTTSLLSPQTRASMFNASVIRHPREGDTSFEETVDVEEDSSALYGPPQFCEDDVVNISEDDKTEEIKKVADSAASTSRRDVEKKTVPQCLICMDVYDQPVVSVQCWHVYCERCWLKAMATQKLCPKCKTITCSGDLRRIFL